MNLKDAAPIAAALILAGGVGIGVVALIASGEPIPAADPAPAVVTTPASEPTRLAPRCFETSVNGTRDCAWVPIAACLTDEDGDDAIPADVDGCYWDARSRGNHAGASYVIWRGGRG